MASRAASSAMIGLFTLGAWPESPLMASVTAPSRAVAQSPSHPVTQSPSRAGKRWATAYEGFVNAITASNRLRRSAA